MSEYEGSAQAEHDHEQAREDEHQREETRDEMRVTFAKWLDRYGEPRLANAVRSGIDNSHGGLAALNAMVEVTQPLKQRLAALTEKLARSEAKLKNAESSHEDTIRELHGIRKQLAAARAEREDGVGLIAAERARQIAVEGWAPEHDDEHEEDELAMAAACYAKPAYRRSFAWQVPEGWPWGLGSWKPGDSASPVERIRDLSKAGALCAAEIDRLQRRAILAKQAKS